MRGARHIASDSALRVLRRRGGTARGRRGGGLPPWNPLTDPDYLGLWVAPDATDNGTDLTVPNRKAGGTSLVALGVGRQTVDATGINNGPAFNHVGATKVLAGALAGATGKSAMTVVVAAKVNAFGASALFRFGTGNQNWFCYNTAGGGFQTFKQGGSGVNTVTQVNKGLRYPRVVTSRFDVANTPDISPPRQQGLTGPSTPSGTDADGTLAAGSLYLGSNSNAADQINGWTYGAMAFSRRLSDAHAAIAEQYMNALMGQALRCEIAQEGDSLIACASVGGQQMRGHAEALYQAEAAIDGRFWLFNNGWNSPATTPFTNDWSPAGSGKTVAIMRTDWGTNGLGTNYQPDKMMLTIGTNDIAVSGHSNATLYTNLATAIADDLMVRRPGMEVWLQKIFPRNDSKAAQVLDWNANYHGPLCAALQAAGHDVKPKSTWETVGAALGGYTYLDGVHIAAANTAPLGVALYADLKAMAGA